MKRKTFLLLLLTLLLVSSCGGTPDTPAGGSTAAEPEKTEIVLHSGGKTVYRLIRPEEAPAPLIELYTGIAQAMKSGGIAFYGGNSDWLPRGAQPDAAEKELLLGNTSRPESGEVLSELGPDDYAVTVRGNKIVIAAHNEVRLREAVNVFCTELLRFETGDGGITAVLTGTRVQKGGGADVIQRNGGLASYTVVTRTGWAQGQESAETLAAALKTVYSAAVKIADDSAPKNGPEIVIGSADRDICRKFAAAPTWDLGLVAEDGGDIVILGDSDYASAAAVTQFIARFVSQCYSDTLVIGEGTKMTETNYTFAESPARAEGTDIRVMSFNLLAELWNDKPPIEGRDTAAMAVVRAFAPDVLGIQEVSDGWHTHLAPLLSDGYAMTDRNIPDGRTNYSTLVYNTKTLKLLEHGVNVYSQGNDPKLRCATWAQFEVIATGKKFIALSTHWDLGSNPQFQAIHSEEMAALVLQLENRYGCPVVTTGDYNSNEKSANYTNFVTKTGYQDAKFTAKKAERTCKTTHTRGASFADTPGNAIDHIFGSAGVEFLYYNILKDQVALDASDHCPIYADVKLK